MRTGILSAIRAAKSEGRKLLLILIDPDRQRLGYLEEIVELAGRSQVDYLLIGGSILMEDALSETLQFIRSKTTIPLVLFPGNTMQISSDADALLLLSLISGRNPDYLIGKQFESAPRLKASGLEIIPTGYILIDGGRPTAVSYITQTMPIPADKPEMAVCTALAGEMLGLQLIYLEAGSGAGESVSADMIRQVSAQIDIPLIVGGGIKTPAQARAILDAGADAIVVGTAVERDPHLLPHFAQILKG